MMYDEVHIKYMYALTRTRRGVSLPSWSIPTLRFVSVYYTSKSGVACHTRGHRGERFLPTFMASATVL